MVHVHYVNWHIWYKYYSHIVFTYGKKDPTTMTYTQENTVYMYIFIQYTLFVPTFLLYHTCAWHAVVVVVVISTCSSHCIWLTLGAHARSEGYCSCPVCVCMYMYVCPSVRSFLPPRASRPRNIRRYICVHRDTEKLL